MSSLEATEMKFSSFCISRRRCVIGIAILEAIYSLFGIVGYWYASFTYPLLKQYVVLPDQFLNDKLIIGLINSLSIVCGFEFFLAIALLDGARYVRLGQIRFWLTTMLTYKIMSGTLLIGMELAGLKAPQFNAYMFSIIFLRFMEMLLVYVFLEEETLKRMRLKVRRIRESMSSATSCSNLSVRNDSVLDTVSIDPNPEPIIDGTNGSMLEC